MRLAVFLLLLATVPATAIAERERLQRAIDVRHEDGLIDIHVVADLRAPLAEVRSLFEDHDALPLFMPMVERSTVIDERADGTVRRRADMRVCLFFICRDLAHVLDVRREGGGGEAATVPQLSSFRSGTVEWLVTAGPGETSRLIVAARFEPRRSVPPLIGSWAVKRKIGREIEMALRRVEASATGAGR